MKSPSTITGFDEAHSGTVDGWWVPTGWEAGTTIDVVCSVTAWELLDRPEEAEHPTVVNRAINTPSPSIRADRVT